MASSSAAATNVPADVASPATTTAAAATNVPADIADPASATTTAAAATNVPADIADAATNVPADIANPDPASANPWKRYTPLLYASFRGDWESAIQFLDQNPNASKDPITNTDHTALITAVRAGQFKFAEKLLLRMQPEDLRHKDFEGFTVLHHAATKGNSKTTGMLVRKFPDLTQIRNNYGETPLLRAATFGEEEIVWYLLEVTRNETEHSPFGGEEGAHLLNSAIQMDLYDVALKLIDLYPGMVSTVDKRGRHAIRLLAAKYWRSLSLDHEQFWQSCVTSTLEKPNMKILNALLQLVPSVKQFRDGKIMYGKYMKLVEQVCNIMSRLDQSEIPKLLGGAILEASKNGHVELIKSIIDLMPTQIQYYNKDGERALHVAIKHRQKNVLRYLKNLGFNKQLAIFRVKISGDTVLHLAAKMAPLSKLKEISGAALQVQHELQWYQEVEKIVSPAFVRLKNEEIKNPTNRELNQVAEVPRDMFSREHGKLLAEGEKWMKDMASSSMLVATLIATVVFAAAFTVPGGNVSDKGRPIFLSSPAYMVFAVSNALAFFSSLTSVLMFSTLLTTRYAEDDFLKALPQKLIIGLSMLFFAIANMTIAFSATYFIMLGDKRLWVSILIALLTSFPVALFAFLQSPLLLEMIHSIYWSKF